MPSYQSFHPAAYSPLNLNVLIESSTIKWFLSSALLPKFPCISSTKEQHHALRLVFKRFRDVFQNRSVSQAQPFNFIRTHSTTMPLSARQPKPAVVHKGCGLGLYCFKKLHQDFTLRCLHLRICQICIDLVRFYFSIKSIVNWISISALAFFSRLFRFRKTAVP